MEVTSKQLDKWYQEWSGQHHTENSNHPVHGSDEATDFARYCINELSGSLHAVLCGGLANNAIN